MSNFNRVSRNGNTLIDCAPRDFYYRCRSCKGSGVIEFYSKIELFDYVDSIRHDRKTKNLEPLTFKELLKMSKELYYHGRSCPECGD